MPTAAIATVWPSHSLGPRQTAGIRRQPAGLFLAIDLLAPLVRFLCLEAERGDRPRIEPGDPDRLAGLLAIAVGAVVDALQRRVDLGDELALAVACPQFQRPIALRGGAVRHVCVVLALLLEVLQRLAAFAEDVLPPLLQLLSEVIPLPRVHERLVFAGSVFKNFCARHSLTRFHPPLRMACIMATPPTGKPRAGQ